MPTRTARLATALPPANVATTLLTVPAGFTYLVKHATLSDYAVLGDTVSLYAQDGSGFRAYVVFAKNLAASQSLEWSGFLALNAGDILVALSTGGNTAYWIDGAKLVGVA